MKLTQKKAQNKESQLKNNNKTLKPEKINNIEKPSCV